MLFSSGNISSCNEMTRVGCKCSNREIYTHQNESRNIECIHARTRITNSVVKERTYTRSIRIVEHTYGHNNTCVTCFAVFFCQRKAMTLRE